VTNGFSSKLNVLTNSSMFWSLRHCSHSVNIKNAFSTSNLRARRKRSYKHVSIMPNQNERGGGMGTRVGSSSLSVKPASWSCLRKESSFCCWSGVKWPGYLNLLDSSYSEGLEENNTLDQHRDLFEGKLIDQSETSIFFTIHPKANKGAITGMV